MNEIVRHRMCVASKKHCAEARLSLELTDSIFRRSLSSQAELG